MPSQASHPPSHRTCLSTAAKQPMSRGMCSTVEGIFNIIMMFITSKSLVFFRFVWPKG